MNENLEKIPCDKISCFNSRFLGKEATFINIDETLYLLVTKVIEKDTICSFCKEEGAHTFLVGRDNAAYRLHFCLKCSYGSLQESKEDYEKIPIKILELINNDFIIKKNEE